MLLLCIVLFVVNVFAIVVVIAITTTTTTAWVFRCLSGNSHVTCQNRTHRTTVTT